MVLYGRKIPGTPYGGTWQARRTGRLRDLWATWREERDGRREFDRFRLRLRRVSENGLTLERLW